MVDMAGLAASIIHKENNPNLKDADFRRQFLENLGQELCLDSVQLQSADKLIKRTYFVRTVVKVVIGFFFQILKRNEFWVK